MLRVLRSCGHAVPDALRGRDFVVTLLNLRSHRLSVSEFEVINFYRVWLAVFCRVNGVINILFFFEFTYGVGLNIYREVHAGLDDAYHHLVLASHPDQFALQSGEGTDDHLHPVALGVDVAAHLHVGIAAAEDAEVGDLLLRYGDGLCPGS